MVRTGHTNYFMLSVEMKGYIVFIDGQNFFDKPVKNNIRTYNNVLKITTGQGDDYTTGCLLFCPYFNEHYKMIVALSKQQAPHANSKAITANQFYCKCRLHKKQSFSLFKKQKKLI